MPNNPLFHPVLEERSTASLRDRVQIALAIADTTVLKSLLGDCIPAIAHPDLIDAISSQVSAPVREQQFADGLIHFEALKCVLALSPEEVGSRWGHARCESKTYDLGQGLSFAQATALLAHVGFTPQQVQDILNLSYEANYKSWWYTLDELGDFTVPFLRLIRTLRYPNGTFTIQYKDYFDQEKPLCFQSLSQKVLVEIRSETQSFSETLQKINAYREALGVSHAVLICNTIAELEAQAFISQGISIYSAADLVLPTHANCAICGSRDCPMNGTENSPIAICYRFCVEGSYV